MRRTEESVLSAMMHDPAFVHGDALELRSRVTVSVASPVRAFPGAAPRAPDAPSTPDPAGPRAMV